MRALFLDILRIADRLGDGERFAAQICSLSGAALIESPFTSSVAA
ncbi:MAG: hypothetical protein WBC90_10650 [Albidovulum sp.]